jgi:hypothetical protein
MLCWALSEVVGSRLTTDNDWPSVSLSIAPDQSLNNLVWLSSDRGDLPEGKTEISQDCLRPLNCWLAWLTRHDQLQSVLAVGNGEAEQGDGGLLGRDGALPSSISSTACRLLNWCRPSLPHHKPWGTSVIRCVRQDQSVIKH